MDQRNVSSATVMLKLADLLYESNRDGNTNIYAKRNCYSRGNQPFKAKNFPTPSKNSVNAVSGNRKPEWLAQKPMASQIRFFIAKCKITKDLNVTDSSRGRTIVQELG